MRPTRAAGPCTAAPRVLGELRFGFGEDHFYLRVDPVPEAIAEIPDFQLRVTLWDSRETRITVRVEQGKFAGCVLEQSGVCLLHPEGLVSAGIREDHRGGTGERDFRFEGRRSR